MMMIYVEDDYRKITLMKTDFIYLELIAFSEPKHVIIHPVTLIYELNQLM